MYAWQHAQPSRTNYPCGLTLTFSYGSRLREGARFLYTLIRGVPGGLRYGDRSSCPGRFLVVIAWGTHLFPFRTEPLSPAAPMVLPLWWESRSPPGAHSREGSGSFEPDPSSLFSTTLNRRQPSRSSAGLWVRTPSFSYISFFRRNVSAVTTYKKPLSPF